MKLKLARLANSQDNKLIASVCYGADDQGRGEKRWTTTIAVGDIVEVGEELGHAILGAYSKYFDIVGNVSAGARKIATENDGHVATSPANADAEQIIDNELLKKPRKTKDVQGANASA